MIEVNIRKRRIYERAYRQIDWRSRLTAQSRPSLQKNFKTINT